MYPLTAHFPKPLLPIGHDTIIGRLMRDTDQIACLHQQVIVTNHRFYHCFINWEQQQSFNHPVTILDDGSTDNDNRLGAVVDLLFAIDHCGIDEDILVMAADNVLSGSLLPFVAYYRQKRSSVIMCYREDNLSRLQRTGVICKDADDRVTKMEEKPSVPFSHWAVPPYYIYTQKDLSLIRRFVREDTDHDAPGRLACYLSQHTTLHAWQMTMQRQDVGDLETYEKAIEN